MSVSCSRRNRVLLPLAVLTVVSTLFSQAQAPQGAPPPSVRVSTRLVLVDVVVRDKQGKPVTGLKPEDFTLQEKGKAQKIAFFSTPEDAARKAEAPQLAPGIYSNKPEFRSPGGPVTAIVLDAANTPFQDQAYARQQMLKYVREQLKSGQKIGVFTLTNSLGVLQDFTSDPQVLLAALEKYKPQEQAMQSNLPRPISATANSVFSQAAAAAGSFEGAQVAYVLDRRVETTLLGMRSLARALAGIPGRKEIIWLTAAFPFDLIPENRNISEAELIADLPTIDIRQKDVNTRAAGNYAATQRGEHADEIRQVAAQMANAQIAIYPVDVRGLISGVEFQRQDVANRQGGTLGGRAIVRMSDVTASQQTMQEMAAETGGKAYVNQNEIKEGVALAIADNSASYTLGYYPEDKKWDGKYRSIKVKLNRDAEMRYRRGYFAVDPTQIKDKDKKPPEQEVAEALQDTAPNTQIIFSSRVKPADQGKVGIDFLVDTNSVSAEEVSGGKKLNLSFYGVIYSPQGKMLGNKSTKVDQTFNAETYQQLQKQGLLLHLDVDSVPGNNQLKMAVRDNRTGYVGTLEAPLKQ